jgi:polysaccharide export outer membrane protein
MGPTFGHRQPFNYRLTCPGRCALGLVVAASLLGALASAQAPAPSRPVDQGTFRIGPGDVLEILVWGNSDLSRPATVRPDGYISMPLLNDVLASGLTPMQLRDQVKKRLAEFVSAAEVFVIVSQVHSYRVSVIGKVNHSGQFELPGPTTIVEILALAGGLQEYADEDHIFVLRRGPTTAEPTAPSAYLRIAFNYKKVLEAGGESRNFGLLPNDIVVVP